MSKSTELLEAAVAQVIASRPAAGERPNARQCAAIDHAFARVMKIISPRIRHFIRQYGLAAHWDDAEQVCAIAVHRAIEAYDPGKAMFTTFVNWQIRGELQGLRFRLMEDQRPSARKVEATTVSLQSMERGADGEDISFEALIEDEQAQERAEASAADHLAERTREALLRAYVQHLREIGIAQLRRKVRAGATVTRRTDGSPALPKYVHSRASHIEAEELRKLEERIERDCEIISRHLFGRDDASASEGEAPLTRERIRQITRRAARVISEIAATNPRFASPGRAPMPHTPSFPGVRFPETRRSHASGTPDMRATDPELGLPELFPAMIGTRPGLAGH